MAIQHITTYEATPTSCGCGGNTAWVEKRPNGTEVMRSCVCHETPRNLDLGLGTTIPTQVWAVIGQRGFSVLCEDEYEADFELHTLDNKYLPAYKIELDVQRATVLAINEVAAGFRHLQPDPLNVGGELDAPDSEHRSDLAPDPDAGLTRKVDRFGIIRYFDSNGKLHRQNGPAIEYADGTRQWYRDGKRHRENGPAVEYADGTCCWYRDGKLHREDGPAYERASCTRAWYLNGKPLSEAEFKARA